MNSTKDDNVYYIEKGTVVSPREMKRRRKQKFKEKCIDATHLASRLELLLRSIGMDEYTLQVIHGIPKILETKVRANNES